jgi:chromosome segregation ATPase
MLTISDMSLLVHNNISNEIVEKVIDAKREDPTLTKSEVTTLIASLREQIAGKDNSIEEATSQLTTTVGRLDDAQREIDRLSAELANVRQEQAREKTKAQEAQVSLASTGKQVSTLQHTIAGKEREVEQLTAEIAKLKANPVKVDVEVPTVPPSYSTLEEAVAAKLAEHTAVKAQLEAAQAQLPNSKRAYRPTARQLKPARFSRKRSAD